VLSGSRGKITIYILQVVVRIKFRLDLTNSRLDFFISKSSEMPYGITFWRIFGYSISDTTISHFFIEK
jgi:hypothetical protein